MPEVIATPRRRRAAGRRHAGGQAQLRRLASGSRLAGPRLGEDRVRAPLRSASDRDGGARRARDRGHRQQGARRSTCSRSALRSSFRIRPTSALASPRWSASGSCSSPSSTSCPLRGRSRTWGADRSPGSSASRSESCWCSASPRLIGNRDDSGEPVTAGEWAQNVCGAVGVWRGELEAIVEDIRTPNANATAGEEPQSETPQGRTGFIRKGLERGVQATETMVEGVDNAGVPDTENGEEAADDVSDWAESCPRATSRRRRTRSTTRRTPSRSRSSSSRTRRERSGPRSSAACRRSPTSLELDPALAVAFRDTSTCQQLREERGR